MIPHGPIIAGHPTQAELVTAPHRVHSDVEKIVGRLSLEPTASIHGAMLPLGKLSVQEEFPDSVAHTIEPFLLDRS